MRAAARARRVALTSYPPSFRHRYGDELGALVDDTEARWRDVADLALGSCRAWARPTFAGGDGDARRARLEATTVTVLAAWCASVVAAAGFAKAVDDPRLPGLHGAAWTAYDIGAVVLEVTAAVVLAAGFAFWLALIVPAVRARRRDIVLPAAAPAAIVAAWLGVTGLVALYAHHVSRHGTVSWAGLRGAVVVTVLAAYVAITLTCVVGCATSAALALRRARVGERRLVTSTAVAALSTLGVTAQGVAAAVVFAVLIGGRGALDPRDIVLSSATLVVLVGAATIALVSARRGYGAMRGPLPADGSG